MQSKHFLSAALLPFVLVSCGTQEVTAPLPEIRTETARVGHLSDDYRIITTVEGMRMTDLSFKASGRVVSVLVDVGDRVRAGDTIALLGSEEAKASVAGLGESLHAMDTSVASVHTAAESLRNTIDPVNQLYIGRIALAKDDEHRAGINVEIAQSDYALARELERFGVGIASGALALSDESVDQARKNLALARTNYEAGLRVLSGSTTLDSELVDQAQANLDRVRNELAHTESLIASEREAARKSGLSALASAYVVARDARDFIDTELGVTDTNALVDPARYRLLGSKDSTSKTRAEDAFRTFNQSYQTMLAWYEEHIDGRSDVDMETVRTGLRDGLKTLDLLRQALHSFSTVVEQSIAGTDFPQAFIDALKIETTSRLSSLETVILTDNGGGMKGALSAIEAVDAKESLVLGGLQDAVTLAENSLRTARTGLWVGTDDRIRSLAWLEANLAIAESLLRAAEDGRTVRTSEISGSVATLSANVQSKKRALDAAKVSLDSARRGVEIISSERDAKIAETRAGVANLESSAAGVRANRAQTATQYDLAVESVDSGTIVAPYDGIVTRRFVDEWVVISAGTPIVALADDSGRIARISVDPTIGEVLSLGDEISILRLGESETLSGTIALVAEHLDEKTHKIAIEIFVPDSVRIGETVSISIASPSGTNVSDSSTKIIIPTRAIIHRYGSPAVFIVDTEGFVHVRRINLIASDPVLSSVVGVDVDETVVVEGQDRLFDGQKVR